MMMMTNGYIMVCFNQSKWSISASVNHFISLKYENFDTGYFQTDILKWMEVLLNFVVVIVAIIRGNHTEAI